MPVDLEMLMSTSPHVFFPYNTLYTECYGDYAYDRSLSFPQRHCAPRKFEKHQQLFHSKSLSELNINRTCSNPRASFVSNDSACAARKKKVSFADDRGLKLVEVREIPNAPKWANDVMTLLIGNRKRSVVKEKKWKVAFDHPPWSDDKLIEKLETHMVALEYVSVNECDESLFGTVKVKNFVFEKNVFLRVTYDRWLTLIDVPCTYMASNDKQEKSAEYDTFCFNTKILPIASRYEVIEFCVGFQCNGKEYWDNNGDINYRLVAEYSKPAVVDDRQECMPKPTKQKFNCVKLGKNPITDYNMWSRIMLSENY